MRLYDKRLDRIEVEIRKRVKAFWVQFSTDELKAMKRGDPEVFAKFDRLNGDEITALNLLILTPNQLAKLKRIEEELQASEVTE